MIRNICILLTLFSLVGCGDKEHPTREGSAPTTEEFNTAAEFEILSPIPTTWQDSHNIDTSYYKKMTLAWGIPIVANDAVDDLILKNAAELLTKQLSDESLVNQEMATKIRNKLWQRYMKVAIYPTISGAGKTKQLPEFKNLSPASAYSATKESPTIGISDFEFDFKPLEETGNDGNSFSHELTHSIHLLAGDLFPNFEKKLSTAYDASIANNLWPDGAYINENKLEYLAEGAELWFGWHTSYAQDAERSDLLESDPGLYNVLNLIYNHDFPSFKNGQLSYVQENITIRYRVSIDNAFDYGIDTADLSQYKLEVLVNNHEQIPLYRSHLLREGRDLGDVFSSGPEEASTISLSGLVIPDPKNETLGSNYKFKDYRFVFKLTSGHVLFDCSLSQAQIIAETQLTNTLDIELLNSYCDVIQ